MRPDIEKKSAQFHSRFDSVCYKDYVNFFSETGFFVIALSFSFSFKPQHTYKSSDSQGNAALSSALL